MPSPESSLPDAWVKKIFATMRATYGSAFDRQWQCPAGADPTEHAAEMIAHWGRELRGYQQAPQAISYALDNLPEHPPNLIEFRAICRRRPDASVPQLPAPRTPPPANMAEAVAGIVKVKPEDPKAWAYALRDREQRGAGLTQAQKTMWRAALEPRELS